MGLGMKRSKVRIEPSVADDYSGYNQSVIETVFWSKPYDIQRGYILWFGPSHGNKWVVILNLKPLQAKNFHYLRDARQWAKQTVLAASLRNRDKAEAA